MSLHALVEKWRDDAAELMKNDDVVIQHVGMARQHDADELESAIAGGGEAVAQLTTYEDTNSFSARMHDVVHDLPAGTYSLYLHPAGPVQVDADMVERACVAHYADWLKFHQHERENFRKHMRAALEAAPPTSGPEFHGIKIVEAPAQPDGTAIFRDVKGRVLGTITGIGATPAQAGAELPEFFGPDEAGCYYVKTNRGWFYARPQEMLTPEQFAELAKRGCSA